MNFANGPRIQKATLRRNYSKTKVVVKQCKLK